MTLDIKRKSLLRLRSLTPDRFERLRLYLADNDIRVTDDCGWDLNDDSRLVVTVETELENWVAEEYFMRGLARCYHGHAVFVSGVFRGVRGATLFHHGDWRGRITAVEIERHAQNIIEFTIALPR